MREKCDINNTKKAYLNKRPDQNRPEQTRTEQFIKCFLPGFKAMFISVVIRLGGWQPCPDPPY